MYLYIYICEWLLFFVVFPSQSVQQCNWMPTKNQLIQKNTYRYMCTFYYRSADFVSRCYRCCDVVAAPSYFRFVVFTSVNAHTHTRIEHTEKKNHWMHNWLRLKEKKNDQFVSSLMTMTTENEEKKIFEMNLASYARLKMNVMFSSSSKYYV